MELTCYYTGKPVEIDPRAVIAAQENEFAVGKGGRVEGHVKVALLEIREGKQVIVLDPDRTVAARIAEAVARG